MAGKKNKESGKSKRKWIIVIPCILIVVLLIVFFPIKYYKYSDGDLSYNLKLNKITRLLDGDGVDFCNAVNCHSIETKCSVKLTKDEYDNVIKIWDDKQILLDIFYRICKDDEILYESFEDSHEKSIDDYNKMDLNSDGKVTNREFANMFLDDAVKEKEESK